MKNKIALATAALVAGSSFSTAEIVINDFLSFEGFVDMSYSHTDQEVGNGSESDNSYDIDQVEISWLFDFDPVTAQIDLAYENSDGDNGIVEQAFATYHFDNGGAVTAGRFASMLGFEAFEPTGLYQYSFAYNAAEDAANPLLNTHAGILPLYYHGVQFTYEGEGTFFGIALVDEADNTGNFGRLGGDDASDYAIEVAGAMNWDNGLTWFAGARYADGDVIYEDQYILNSYVSYETGAWVFGAELSYAETDFGAGADAETLQGLLMANFAYSEAASVTGRVSFVDYERGNADEDFVKYTLAHGYAFTDNLFLVNEISFVDGETVADVDTEITTFVVELIFSF